MFKQTHMGLSENFVYPIVPNGFADHYPYEMAISLGIYHIFKQTHMKPYKNSDDVRIFALTFGQ